jgi:prepilin signal peptidase PulO-like enzyme (type II secretory pathway)
MIVLALIVLGICFGSFVNAFVWRLHEQQNKRSKFKKKDLSIVKGRSMCVHCGYELTARDLIPVFSWMTLRGKCRYCHKSIPDTPLTELITPLLFVISYLYWPYQLNGRGISLLVLWLVFVVSFVSLAVYDFRWQLLPNKITYPLVILASGQVLFEIMTGGGSDRLLGAFWGVVFGAGIFWVLYQWSSGRFIGGGDVKLGIVYGLLLGGPINALLCIFIASVLGTFIALPFIMAGKADGATKIPFGPYLIVATMIVYLFGADLVGWYRAATGI